jgi:GTP-binding protein Era
MSQQPAAPKQEKPAQPQPAKAPQPSKAQAPKAPKGAKPAKPGKPAPRKAKAEKAPQPFRSGFVAVVGRPNVGKSTLVNKLVGQKVAITSEKAQTTRHAIHGVVTTDEAQIVFVDTPGIHKPHHLLGEQIVRAATDVLDDVDVRVFLVDCQEPAGKGDQFIAELLKQSKKPTILALNKVDRVKEVPEAIFQSYKALGDWDAVVPLSARTGRNHRALLAQIVKRLPAGVHYYDPDVPTDQTLRQIAGELIREQILRQTSEEIPHSVAVRIDEFDESAQPLRIAATIFVERDSQKGIVIGEGGARLKEIGRQARQQIESQVGDQVFLELWVKVLKNWRKEKASLKRLGYITD